MKTLLEIYEEESLSENLMEQAVKEALEKGFIRKSDLKKNPELARYALEVGAQIHKNATNFHMAVKNEVCK